MRTLNTLTLALALLSGLGAEGLLGRITDFFSVLSAPESVDTGCKLDPNGKCAPAPTSDTGCELDPSGGRCAPAPTTDTGCKLDPDGNPVCYPGS